MAIDNTVSEWTGYLCPQCGKYKFAKAAQNKYKRANREAYTMERARRELAAKGALPSECVDSWSACKKHIAALDVKCLEEKKSYKVDVEQWLAAGRKMPSPAPTPSKDGWVYPASWKNADYMGMSSTSGQAGSRAGARGLLAPPEPDIEPMTSTTKVAVGLGLGALFVVGGLWWASRKRAARARREGK